MGLVLAFNKASAQPNFTVAAAISGTLESGQELTCTYTVVRARPSNVTVRWYSYADNVGTDQVLLATAATYTLTGTEVGRYIRAIVTATNPAGTVQSTTAYSVAVAANAPPEPPTVASAAVITGDAVENETLTVTASFNNASSVTYQWYSFLTEPTGNPLIPDENTVTLGTDDEQPLTASENGRWIGVNVTGTNAVNSAVTSAVVAMAGVDPYEPKAPAQYSVPAYDDSALEAIYCNAGDDLQAKINQLRPGKKLILQAGASWTGKFVIDPAITLLDSPENEWAYIVSSEIGALPAEGVRVTAANAANMPKIKAGTKLLPNTTWTAVTGITKNAASLTLTHASIPSSRWIAVGGSAELRGANEEEYNTNFRVTARGSTSITLSVPAEWDAPTGSLEFAHIVSQNQDGDAGVLRILYGVSKLRIAGVEITTDYEYQNTTEYGLLTIGGGLSNGYAVGEEIVIDRCYVHGTETGKNKDGAVLYQGAKKIAIKDCTFDYFKGMHGVESHAVQVFSTPGPTLVHNNTIIGCGIAMFICDSGSTRSDAAMPADITITKNYIGARIEWDPSAPSYVGYQYVQKNAIESKGSKRVLIQGNVIHHAWGDGQQLGAPWFCQNVAGTGVSDVDFKDNLIVDCGAIHLANPFDNFRGFGWERMRFQNNLTINMRRFAQMQIGHATSGFERYLTVRNNTWACGSLSPHSFINFSAPSTSLTELEHARFVDNIVYTGLYGIRSNTASGKDAIDIHVTDYLFDSNLIIKSGEFLTYIFNAVFADSGDYYVNWNRATSNAGVGFVDTTFDQASDCALAPESAFYAASTTGGPIGADVSAVLAAVNTSDIPVLG